MAGSPTSKMHEVFAARAQEIGYAGWQYRDMPGAVLGPVRRAGPSDPDDRQRNGSAAPRAPDGPQRGPGRRADHRLHRRRQGGAAAPRSRRPPGDAGPMRRARRRADPNMATSRSSRSARSSARCSSCAARAATISSASPRSIWTISFGVDDRGRGVVNILAADKLMASPRLYSTFLLWLLSRAVRAASRDRRPPTSRCSSSSSTKRTCCSTMRHRRCSKRSSRSCG